MADYPKYACESCCRESGGSKKSKTVTYEIGICEVCGMRKPVTSPENWGMPKFQRTVYNITMSGTSKPQVKTVNGKIVLSSATRDTKR